MGNSGYVSGKFKVSATVEGFGDVEDIVSISATFGLNSIPTAALTFACGVNAETGAPASVHKMVAQGIKMRAEVKVFLTIENADGDKEKMPNQKITIFEGYYAGFGYQRAHDNAAYTMHLIHWLDDLNIGSMMSGNWFPNAPFNLATDASCWTVGQERGGSGAVIVPIIDQQGKIINFPNLVGSGADLWGKVIKEIFRVIAGWKPPETRCPTEIPQDTKGKIVAALEKMPGKSPNNKQLQFKDPGNSLNASSFQNAVNAGLTKNALETFSYSTFWNKLIGEYAAQFFFAVSPGVDFAQVIPFFGGLRWRLGNNNFKTIYADEYGHANFMSNTAQILEGVDMFWVPQANGGIILGNQNQVNGQSFCEPVGMFPPRPVREYSGTVLVKEMPGWLGNYFTESGLTPSSTGLQDQRIGDAVLIDYGKPDAPGKLKVLAELQKNMKNSNICDRFCEQWYKSEILQQRYGELSGKLRFDIAPGSTIKIQAPRSVMRGLPDSSSMDMCATVTQVSYVINAEQASAGTAFSLANIRTMAENRNPLFTGDEPPLYTKAWEGGPLTSNAK